jgi:molecular chaperone DnaJ
VRDQSDIHLELPLNIAQAALGAAVKLPTVDGQEELLEIPPGTQSGRAFRKRGLGVPHLQRSGRGDMIITVRVTTPTNLTSDQKELLRELAKTFDDQSVEPQPKGFFDRIFGSS